MIPWTGILAGFSNIVSTSRYKYYYVCKLLIFYKIRN
jgi:hypothetical protein